MVRAIVTGACGKMGKMIRDVIADSGGIILAGCTETKGHKSIGSEIRLEEAKSGNIKVVDSLEKTFVINDLRFLIKNLFFLLSMIIKSFPLPVIFVNLICFI